jgi:hypothetical protein
METRDRMFSCVMNAAEISGRRMTVRRILGSKRALGAREGCGYSKPRPLRGNRLAVVAEYMLVPDLVDRVRRLIHVPHVSIVRLLHLTVSDEDRIECSRKQNRSANISMLRHALLILWLWSEHPEEEEKSDDKDGDELEVIVK